MRKKWLAVVGCCFGLLASSCPPTAGASQEDAAPVFPTPIFDWWRVEEVSDTLSLAGYSLPNVTPRQKSIEVCSALNAGKNATWGALTVENARLRSLLLLEPRSGLQCRIEGEKLVVNQTPPPGAVQDETDETARGNDDTASPELPKSPPAEDSGGSSSRTPPRSRVAPPGILPPAGENIGLLPPPSPPSDEAQGLQVDVKETPKPQHPPSVEQRPSLPFVPRGSFDELGLNPYALTQFTERLRETSRKFVELSTSLHRANSYTRHQSSVLQAHVTNARRLDHTLADVPGTIKQVEDLFKAYYDPPAQWSDPIFVELGIPVPSLQAETPENERLTAERRRSVSRISWALLHQAPHTPALTALWRTAEPRLTANENALFTAMVSEIRKQSNFLHTLARRTREKQPAAIARIPNEYLRIILRNCHVLQDQALSRGDAASLASLGVSIAKLETLWAPPPVF